MRVFISWSGERSRQIAEEVHRWMPRVIQAINPFISTNDIAKGAQWTSEMSAQLAGTDFGVACLVPENIDAPWIHFEAGAVSQSIKRDTRGRVAPILFGVNQLMLAGNPLEWFQCTTFAKDDMRKLMGDMNYVGDSEILKPSILDLAFDKNWDDLDVEITRIMGRIPDKVKSDPSRARQDKILDELGVLVREQLKRLMGLEEKLGVLTKADVKRDDTFLMMSFADALLEFCQKMETGLEQVISPCGRWPSKSKRVP